MEANTEGNSKSVLPISRNSATIHSAEDAVVERPTRENEPDYYGKSPKYADTCKIAEDILG